MATAPGVAPVAQGWGWRLCSALSIFHNGCWKLAPAGVADCQFARLPVPVKRVRGRQRRHKRVLPPAFFSAPDDAVQSRHPACSTASVPALTSASPAGVSVYFIKFSMNSFRQRGGGFHTIVPATRRCYAGRECGYPRTAVQSGSPNRTAADGRFPALSEPFRMAASIIARVSLMETVLPVPFSRC